ncbi:hypothetical protein AAVH_41733 [Aphelenchoides avenae]|nr:hypothetical protein AAVH_41733 [Aphelenchus avenae]
MDQKATEQFRSRILKAQRELNEAATGFTNARLILADEEVANVESDTLRQKLLELDEWICNRIKATTAANLALCDVAADLPSTEEGSVRKGTRAEAQQKRGGRAPSTAHNTRTTPTTEADERAHTNEQQLSPAP